jgi:hypothetical protein
MPRRSPTPLTNAAAILAHPTASSMTLRTLVIDPVVARVQCRSPVLSANRGPRNAVGNLLRRPDWRHCSTFRLFIDFGRAQFLYGAAAVAASGMRAIPAEQITGRSSW